MIMRVTRLSTLEPILDNFIIPHSPQLLNGMYQFYFISIKVGSNFITFVNSVHFIEDFPLKSRTSRTLRRFSLQEFPSSLQDKHAPLQHTPSIPSSALFRSAVFRTHSSGPLFGLFRCPTKDQHLL